MEDHEVVRRGLDAGPGRRSAQAGRAKAQGCDEKAEDN
jgi:hypothetical protein